MTVDQAKRSRFRPAWLYRLAAGLAIFSGLAQMPIMRRYYLADLPLMDWAGQFYVTSDLHYLAAAVLVGLLAWRLTAAGRAARPGFGPRRGPAWALWGVIILTGGLKALRNAGVYLPPELLVANTLAHLGAAMTFIIGGLVLWLAPRRKVGRG